MASKERDPSNGDWEWEGYSDYRTVSRRIGRSVDDAIDAYAVIDSLHAEHARVNAEQAAEARSRILSAALRLVPELRENKGQKDVYGDILERWESGGDEMGGDDDYDGPDGGYLNGISDVQFRNECPGWLHQFVLDIRTAGWHLGYLQAGRVNEEDDQEFEPTDVKEMFS